MAATAFAFSAALVSCGTSGSTSSVISTQAKEGASSRSNDLLQVYKKARELKKRGDFAGAREELQKVVSSNFIAGDYAAYDLALMEMADHRHSFAITAVNTMLEKFPDTPLRLKANEIRLRAACAEPASDECEKNLEITASSDVREDFIPERMFHEAARAFSQNSIVDARMKFMKIWLEYPAAPAAAKARAAMDGIERTADETLKAKFVYPSIRQRMERAERLKAAHRYLDAAAEFETVEETAASSAQKEEALYRLADAFDKGRDRPKSKKLYERLLEEYPLTPHKAWAHYHIAAISWNLDDGDGAIASAQKVLKSSPGGDVAKMCHILIGKIYESRGDYKTARSEFQKAIAMGLAPQMEDELRWRRGWMEYKAKNYQEAASEFERAAEKIPHKRQDGKLLYWAARAFGKIGEEKKSARMKEELKHHFPLSYYSAYDDAASGKFWSPDPAALEADFSFDVEMPKGMDDYALRHYHRFEALLEIGHFEGARMEASSIGALLGGGLRETTWLASLYRKANAADLSIRLAKSRSIGVHQPGFSDPYWRIFYPVDHWKQVRESAEINGVNPFVTLAIIRQESAFNPGALSPADARGLMQLIPSTGKKMYMKAGEAKKGEEFDPASLFDPELNIKLGSAHFRELASRYNGNMPRAIAAYNAGAAAVDRWNGRYVDMEDDEFVEMIPYLETREYVKKVIRNMAVYQSVYAVTPQPEARPEAKTAAARGGE